MSTGTHIQNKNSRVDAGWTYSLFEVDTRSGSGRRIEQGTAYTTDWVVDAAGRPVGRGEWDAYSKVYTLLANRDGGWHEIYRRTDGNQLELYGLTGAGSAIVAVGPDNAGRSQAWGLPLDGTDPWPLVTDPSVQVDSVIRDGLSETAVGVHTSGLNPQVLWLDPAIDKRQRGLEASFPDRSVEMVSRSVDNSRVIVRVAGPSNPATYYLVDFASHKADIVGEEYPELANTQLGKVETFTYKARDGVEIPAFLTLPPHGPDKAPPLIVLVHGGPAAHDQLAFNWQTQFLATRGYAVLQPQFRGSTGYGDAFLKAGAGQWGRLMQDDVTDGVNALTASGKVDPHRVCIVGASYGGYAALAGAAFTPSLYACAVSVGGISNLPDLLSYETNHDVMNDDETVYWHTNIGSAVDPRVIEKSPVLAAGQIRAPVLLLYGADDTIVPPAQSEGMARALSLLHKPVTLVRLAGEDHWLSHSETRVRMLQEMETFLSANLHP
jgi:dipeptidyl aminopeptidase/acylaminoacyl peptidase